MKTSSSEIYYNKNAVLVEKTQIQMSWTGISIDQENCMGFAYTEKKTHTHKLTHKKKKKRERKKYKNPVVLSVVASWMYGLR